MNGQSIGTPVVIISHGEKTGHLLGRLVECVQWEYPHPIEWDLNVAGTVSLRWASMKNCFQRSAERRCGWLAPPLPA